ncbi:hypothetical protein SADUNF_Sadunf17G0073800 [Salix dunnii]|uniref:Uncharacterized protein n=1 Tax=Salix dunnii TaxID=1413687 RepID=A0A835MNA8_9ROSI|nr:hypothetical protein SADUNF_Sadunf17G0073800 [Salix dunnii]
METWKGRMEGHGFAGMRLSSMSLIQAKILLKSRTHCCPLQFDGESGGGSKEQERIVVSGKEINSRCSELHQKP